MGNFKVDLHTHSIVSPDGGLKPEQYHKALESGLLDCIAITDHNRIDMALALRNELGERIIVGEEIMTTSGEIVGLFLSSQIEPGLTPLLTVQRIKDQGGVVYIPHPFETVRKGLHPSVLEELLNYIDVIEICNGRAFMQNRSEQAVVWAKLNHVIGVAASDAHGYRGLGKTFTAVTEMPTRENLLKLLISSTPITDRPGLRALLYPKYNVIRKKLRRQP
jgi:predicted metal-dependent phosphoesterase TrpH